MSRQRYWEMVDVGEGMPEYQLEVTPTLIADQVSGSQDYNLMHHDRAFAQSQGAPDMYLNTGFIEAMLCRLVTDWMGDSGTLKKLGIQMRRFNTFGDKLTIKGKVTHKEMNAGEHLVYCDVWVESDREGVTVPGKATISLPSNQLNH